MAIKLAINGFGRIGRSAARIILNRDDLELVAINDTGDINMCAYLLQNDSVHGAFDEVKILDQDHILVKNKKIRVFNTKDPNELDLQGVDCLLECTGAFLTSEKCEVHLKKGAKKVLMSAPAKDKSPTFVLGVNHQNYAGEKIISNASCTTNCLAPLCKVLLDNFGIKKGLMTTIHAYTHGQSLVDVKSSRDYRRSRAAAINIIPTSTGAAKAINLVLPELQGKMHGQSVRVPVPNVSMVDLSAVLEKNVSKDEINEAFLKASQNELKGILGVDENYLVSSDFNGSSLSSIFIADTTQVIADDFIKIMAWYDNEWGYSNRLVEMAKFISEF